jgi:hypothetical protein
MSDFALGFGGNNNNTGSHSPVVGTYSGGSHAPWGMNDNVNMTINGGGMQGWTGFAIALAQLFFAQQQVQLAESYYSTNKTDFDFFNNNYGGSSGPLVTHKNQAFGTPFYVADYIPMVGASLGRVKVYDEKWFQNRRRAHRYALGHQRHIDYTFYMLRRKAVFAAWVAGRRIEDARKDWKDDQIQTHKVQALNFGISVGNIARQGLAQSTEAKERAYDELGSRLGGLSSGLGKFAGYQATRGSAQKVLDRSSSSGANMAPSIGTGPA